MKFDKKNFLNPTPPFVRYYYNYISGESTWDKPEELKVLFDYQQIHQHFLPFFQDLRFENPFGSNDESDSAQIPSPLTADIPAAQTPTSVVPSGTPPVPLPPFPNNYDTYVDDEGNYNYEDEDEDYDEEYDDEYDDEYNEVGTKRQTKDKGKGGSSSKGKDSKKKKDTDQCSGVGIFGLRCIKQRFGIDDILGIKLKSGGSIKKVNVVPKSKITNEMFLFITHNRHSYKNLRITEH